MAKPCNPNWIVNYGWKEYNDTNFESTVTKFSFQSPQNSIYILSLMSIKITEAHIDKANSNHSQVSSFLKGPKDYKHIT